MRRRYVWSPEANALVEVPTVFTQPPRTAYVRGDLPGYVSPVTGLWVEGRKARRDDLARTGSRPWEGKEQEQKESARQQAYAEQASDRRLDESVRRSYHEISPQCRRLLERGD